MKRSGFTLIELLVVIAIISILAAIAVPNIARYIAKAQMAKAVSEISSIELSLTKMLADSGKKDFSQFFTSIPSANVAEALEIYKDWFYKLLRVGRAAINDNVPLRSEVVARLGDSYLDLGKDPWDNRYFFYPGPWKGPMAFRSHVRLPENAAGEPQVYVYDANRKAERDADVPGNPRADGLPGFPAPRSMNVYIWSAGQNLENDQAIIEMYGDPNAHDPLYKGGGDDINNWDNNAGWSGFYGG
ncbi:MAG TPA: type II secretion system protein [Candidatus Hydrogenedentes bacterium]|nr:type II secretion system protein [Candidatus Hydrogenedentota bacterium]HOS03895.1 type II secretion system protein [Candidatus Hydrogenedentota bacterium]